MIDYAALKAEIAKPDYSGMDAVAVAAALNAKMVQPAGHVDVRVADIEGFLRLSLVVSALEDWVSTATAGQARSAARELLGIISGKVTVFETSDPKKYGAIKNLMDGLVAAGSPFVQAHEDALLAMANPPPVPFLQTIGADATMDNESLVFHVQKAMDMK